LNGVLIPFPAISFVKRARQTSYLVDHLKNEALQIKNMVDHINNETRFINDEGHHINNETHHISYLLVSLCVSLRLLIDFEEREKNRV